MTTTIDHACGRHFTPGRLWAKLYSMSGRVFRLLVLRVMVLYELLKRPDTPRAVKATILATLGYLILPFDTIPDVLPFGYTDDIALITSVIASLGSLIDGEDRARAEARATKFRAEGFRGGDPEGGSL